MVYLLVNDYLVRDFKMALVLFVLMASSLTNGQLRDPDYTLNFDSPIYVCADEKSQEFLDTTEVEVGRYNETTAAMSGTIKFLKRFEPETMINIIIEKDNDGDLEMITSHQICDVCGELGNSDSIYKDYLKFLGFPDKCPFEAGNYVVHDLLSDRGDVPINRATAGRYQVTINMYKRSDTQCTSEKVFIACLKLDLLVELL